MKPIHALIALLLLSGCASASPPRRPLHLPTELVSQGETIYFGSVFPLENAADHPTFVYERRVKRVADRQVSTHITRDIAGGVARAESATEDAGHSLRDYTLHGNQFGETGSVHLDGDRVTFRLVDAAGEERTAVETRQGDVAVGPTLVGYIVRHLPALRGGHTAKVRLAVLDRLETIGFKLERVPARPGQTCIEMKPSSFLVGMVVDPIYFTFDTATEKLVRLEGRVPPKVQGDDGWSDFDARVEYQFVAAAYL